MYSNGYRVEDQLLLVNFYVIKVVVIQRTFPL